MGDPAAAILKEAARWKVDLIIVGRLGRSALGRLFLGSVSQRIAAEASCSVRVARLNAQKGSLPIRIAINFEQLPEAKLIARNLARRTWPAGSEARILVSNNHDNGGPDSTVTMFQMITIAKENFRSQAGLYVSSQIVEDNKKFFVKEARKFESDCIFICACSLGQKASQTEAALVEYLTDAHCSIEVVRGKGTRRVFS